MKAALVTGSALRCVSLQALVDRAAERLAISAAVPGVVGWRQLLNIGVVAAEPVTLLDASTGVAVPTDGTRFSMRERR